MDKTTFYLFKTEDDSKFGPVAGKGGDIDFPPTVGGWTEVLDCRHIPYTDKTIAENCELARGVRKKYIIVNADQAQASN